MHLGTHTGEILVIKVLKKYEVRLVYLAKFRKDALSIRTDTKLGWAITQEDFEKFFPKTAEFLLFRNIFGTESNKIPAEEQRRFITGKYRYNTSSLTLRHDYLFIEDANASNLYRRGLASNLRALESFERKLKRVKLTRKKNNGKDK